MSKRSMHLTIEIAWLLNEDEWPDHKLRGVMTRNGEVMSANEVREHLREKQAKGDQVMLMGGTCEGFSPITGCPGHDEQD